MNIYLFFLFLIIVFLIAKYYEKIQKTYLIEKEKGKKKKKRKELLTQYLRISRKPTIWIYLENHYNSINWSSFNSRSSVNNTPSYQLLCIMSVYYHCQKDFNIIVISPSTIYNYLPNFPINKEKFKTISIPKKQDYIGAYVLYKYGGIYIKPNVMVMKNIKNIFQQLKKYELITTSCNKENLKCVYNNISPNSDIIICKRNLPIIKEYSNALYEMITTYNYTSYNFNNYNFCLLSKCIKTYIDNNSLSYLQLPSSYNATRNISNKSISTHDILSNNELLFLNPVDIHFVILDSKAIEKNNKLKWFNRFSVKQIMESNLMIGKLFRKSFGKGDKIYVENKFNSCNYNQENCNCGPSFGNYYCKKPLEKKVIEINFPPKNKQELLYLLKNCNYFDVPKWYTIYKLPTPNR